MQSGAAGPALHGQGPPGTTPPLGQSQSAVATHTGNKCSNVQGRFTPLVTAQKRVVAEVR